MRQFLPLAIVLVITICSLILSLGSGSMGIGIDEICSLYLHSGEQSGFGLVNSTNAPAGTAVASLDGAHEKRRGMRRAVFEKIRLPRVVAAFLGGAILAAAGAVFQCLLRNPLADPYVLGISAGGAVGAVTAMALGFTSISMVAGASFAGALATMMIVLIISRRNQSSNSMLLAGVMINATLSSLISLLVYFAPRVKSVMFWLMGSFSGNTWTSVMFMGFSAMLLGTVIFLASPWMDCLAMGETTAQSLGVPVRRLKVILFLISSAATAIVVAFCGVIGFAGMVIPHFSRALVGSSHRMMVPVCFLAGGAFMCLADTISRTALSPEELPIGIVTGIIGGPLFIYILTRRAQ
ncbi:MAG: iron ABC transporter permease [Candidatus Wallbacteria bacterium HGW-Wallbacteria-1]|jgi:iron complex transport system permease protein|uniref:Iron ABC transporter permease n=1 Tax=Candidatus Wallbacteria bacterium HGW-Wallbacteria-1 TaxID=2013854 RepID=A0A2N1PTV7_9BACT|nr:MAG: iron ABC transporter permease [Candidatus Wallbacteria bacterium HGW-Wallbacteria-1]